MRRRRSQTALTATFAAGLVCGCGTQAALNSSQAHREFGSDGEAIVFDDILTVLEDDSLTDDEKRGELRRLGLDDEDVIDALLSSL